MSKSKSFLDKIIYKHKKKTFRNFNIKYFLPEKGYYKLVKTAANTGKLYSCMISYAGVIGMMHVALFLRFKGS